MGGHGAILYSNIFEINKVIAFSPQYSIDSEFDSTWHKYAKLIDFKFRITLESINQECKYFLVYDDKSPDYIHAEKISHHIKNNNFYPIKFPYTGHSIDLYLNELGVLKTFMIEIIENKTINPKIYLKNRKSSSRYLLIISEYLRKKFKYKLALDIINKAIQINNMSPEIYREKSYILNELGKYAEAKISIEHAFELNPKDLNSQKQLKILLNKIKC